MEELHCNGTPAQIMRRVLAVLAADPDLLWLVGVKDFYPDNKLENLSFWGRKTPDIPDDQDEIKVGIMRGQWPHLGVITAERLPDRVLVTATNSWHRTEVDNAHNIHRSLSEDFGGLAPIWERVKAELHRLSLVIEAEPAQAKQPSALTQALHYRSGNVSNSVIIVGNGNVMGDGSSSRVLQATPAAPDDELISDDPRSKLLQDLDKHFSEEDLRTLCFELGVDYENLPAQGKAGKARELILHLGRVGRVTELIDRCRKLRPNISWEDTSGISPVVDPE